MSACPETADFQTIAGPVRACRAPLPAPEPFPCACGRVVVLRVGETVQCACGVKLVRFGMASHGEPCNASAV